MKNEDIYNGITDIRDDLIAKAGRKGKKRGWRGAMAAALAVCVAAGGAAAWRYLRPAAGLSGEAADPGRVPAGGAVDNETIYGALLTPTAPGGGDIDPPGQGAPSGEDVPGEVYTGAPVGAGASAGGGTVSPEPLADVTYPEREKNPGLECDDAGSYDKWLEQKRELALSDAELETIRNYLKAAMPELLRAGGDENSVVSPMNVYMALGMLAECAGGESRGQVLSLLGTESIEELRELADRTWNRLYNDDGTYSLYLANSLWLRDDLDYSEDAVKSLADNYYAWSYRGEMGSEEYDETLQTWLNGNTNGLLSEEIGDIGFEVDAAMCLASTAYFGDKWDVKFDPEMTESGVFHAPGGDVEAEFMRRRIMSGGQYYRGDGFGAIMLNFEEGGSMWLLLPDEGVSTEEILESKDAVSFLAGDIGAAEGKNFIINLKLPKFDVGSETDIKGALESLGVTDVFAPDRADFTELLAGDNAWVSRVLHGARVRVDEEGCEAAAYTLVPLMGDGAPPMEEMDLTFDRPFLFSVVSGGLPVFSGIVNKP